MKFMKLFSTCEDNKMRKLHLTLAVVCLTAMTSITFGEEAIQPAPEQALEPAAVLAMAQKSYDEGDFAQAEKRLAELKLASPNEPGMADLLAKVQAALKREKDSIAKAAEFPEKSEPAKDSAAEAAGQLVPKKDAEEIDPVRAYQLAEKFVAEGNFKAARETLALICPDNKEVFERAKILAARIEAFEARDPKKDLCPPQSKELDAYMQRKLDRDLANGRKLFAQGKWRDAAAAAEEILEYAPDDRRARKLLEDARIELTDAKVEDYRSRGEEYTREMFAETEKMTAPPPMLPKISRPQIPLDSKVQSEDEMALRKKLNERISLDLIDAPLSYVLDLLSRSIGINIIVSPEAVAGKKITINVQDTTLEEVLEFIAKNEGVTFTRGVNTMYVTTPSQPMLTMRIFHLAKGLTDVALDITSSSGSSGSGTTGSVASSGAKPSDSSDIEKLLAQLPQLIAWPAGSTYYLDRKRNVLFLRSTPDTLDTVEKMLAALDENPVQVLVTTRFIEIDAENLDDLGIQWTIADDYALSSKDGADKLVIDEDSGTTFGQRVLPDAASKINPNEGLSLGMTGILTDPQFQATLKTIMARYKGRVVNAPQIIAVNNSPARFQESEDLWYVSDYDIDRTDLTGAEGVITAEPVVVPRFAQGPAVGFGLTVTPSIGKDSRDITLLLEPIFRRKSLDSISSPLILPGDLGTVNIERPIIIDRRVWAKVTVADGYHVVLGGMVTSTKQSIKTSVPILGDIPLLGALFRRTTVRDQRKHLLIFVSATILTPQGRMYKTDEEELEEQRIKKRIEAIDAERKKVGIEATGGEIRKTLVNPADIDSPDTGVVDVKELEIK